MPANDRSVDRSRKREEIVGVARELFIRDGYDGTSMQRLARALHVAPNTLYWYFPDKDAVLVGVVESLVQVAFIEYQDRRRGSLESQLRWLLDLLAETRGLIATVHARMEVSEAVRSWHDAFHRMAEQALEALLRKRGLTPGHEAAAARAVSFIVEGVVAHQSSKAEQQAIARWLVSMVQPGSPAGDD